jgi:hypothetical protein
MNLKLRPKEKYVVPVMYPAGSPPLTHRLAAHHSPLVRNIHLEASHRTKHPPGGCSSHERSTWRLFIARNIHLAAAHHMPLTLMNTHQAAYQPFAVENISEHPPSASCLVPAWLELFAILHPTKQSVSPEYSHLPANTQRRACVPVATPGAGPGAGRGKAKYF